MLSIVISKSVIKRARENLKKSNLKSEDVFMCLKRFFDDESLWIRKDDFIPD